MVVVKRKKKAIFNIKNVAMTLIGLNVIMFIMQMIFGEGFTNALMLVSGDIFIRPWILITSMFLHAGGTHLLFNMYALLIFGPLIEKRIGSKRFLLAYFVSGLLAGGLYAVFNTFVRGAPQMAAVGASGAIMGILGLVIMLLPNLRVLFFFIIPMSMRTAGIIFAAIDLVGFISGGFGIAHLAHLVGLSVGLLFGWYLKNKKLKFAQQFGGGPKARMKMYTVGGASKMTPKKASGKYEDTIELQKDDLDNYFKYGRL